MTVSYSKNIATNSLFASFKLLLRWKGSIYKDVLLETLVIGAIYWVLQFVYRFLLTEYGRRNFETYCYYCDDICRMVPIGLVLGFFIDLIVSRWWSQYLCLPWPDELAMILCAWVVDSDDGGSGGAGRRQIRKLLRYIHLAFCLGLRTFVATALKRFPAHQSLLAEGLILPEELKVYESSAPKGEQPNIILLTNWAVDIVNDLEATGFIYNRHAVECIIKEIQKFRGHVGGLSCYDWVNIPLVYAQLATISVYAYILASLFALQSLDGTADTAFTPTVSFIQVLFYLCWLKVAERLINPFGEDDDDFEIDCIMDRNILVTDFITTKLFETIPPLTRGVLLEQEDAACASVSSHDGQQHRLSRNNSFLLGSLAPGSPHDGS